MAFLRRERQARFTASSFHPVYLLSGHRSEQLETQKTQAVYPRRQYTDPSQAKELPPQRAGCLGTPYNSRPGLATSTVASPILARDSRSPTSTFVDPTGS